MVTSRQRTLSSTLRDAWVEVDLGAIEHNVLTIRSWLENPEISADIPQDIDLASVSGSGSTSFHPPQLMAVVKSDAYGHGAAGVTEVLLAAGARWLAVASVDEGSQIRTVNAHAPVLVLSPVPAWAVPTALDHNLDLTVTHLSQLSDIAEAALRRQVRARIHLKVDSGMHRLGAAAHQVLPILDAIAGYKSLHLVSVFSHLAKADDCTQTTNQCRQFAQMVETARQWQSQNRLAAAVPDPSQGKSGKKNKGSLAVDEPLFFHLASGEAARRFPFSHFDMARVGLYLFGLEATAVSKVVYPAMSVRGRINHIQGIEAGQGVGYNLTWKAERQTKLASIPIGYADGVDRRLSNSLSGLLHGMEIKQVGLISMDQMLFDITDVPDAQEGDIITLIGADGELTLHLASWAKSLGTITYELACRLRVRLPRIYTRHKVNASPSTAGVTGISPFHGA